MSRIRKAIVAGVGAGLSAGIGALVATLTNGGTLTQETVSAALGTAIVAGYVTGRTAWHVPNARP